MSQGVCRGETYVGEVERTFRVDDLGGGTNEGDLGVR